MPFKSERQRKFIYAKANEGERWARKFVKDAALEDARTEARKITKKREK